MISRFAVKLPRSHTRGMGTLYCGDNLGILKHYTKDETVDLVYLDPPFDSARNYNALKNAHFAAEPFQVQVIADLRLRANPPRTANGTRARPNKAYDDGSGAATAAT